MKKIINLIKKKKKIILFILTPILILSGVIINNIPKNKVVSGSDLVIEEKNDKSYTVKISGEIINPNTYYYNKELYMFEIIENASGLTKYGSIEGINLIEKINSDTNIEIAYSKKGNRNIKIINYSNTNDNKYVYIENTYDIYLFDTNTSYEEIVWKLNLDNSIYNLNIKDVLKEDLFIKKKKALLNINKATYEDLVNLNILNANVITNIINYISENGNISSIEELDNINGIGEKTLEKLLNLICFK